MYWIRNFHNIFNYSTKPDKRFKLFVSLSSDCAPLTLNVRCQNEGNTMSRKSMTQKILCLLALVISSSLAFADIRSATGKPLLDFYTVYGAIDSVKIIDELCNTKFKEYKKQNDLSYSLWRTRHKEFIYKIEQYNHAIVKKSSKGNEALYRKQMIETAQTYEQNKKSIHQMFLDYGEATYRATCSAYPEYTKSEKADFPNYYKEHVQVFEKYWHNK